MSSGVIPRTLVLSLKFERRFPSFEPISITKSDLFNLKFLKTSIESFFSNKNPNTNKYSKIVINGSLDVEPSQIIKKSSENAIIVCVIDNLEIKHKIVKYVKVNNNCNRFIVEEALSHYLYKFITKKPFVF